MTSKHTNALRITTPNSPSGSALNMCQGWQTLVPAQNNCNRVWPSLHPYFSHHVTKYQRSINSPAVPLSPVAPCSFFSSNIPSLFLLPNVCSCQISHIFIRFSQQSRFNFISSLEMSSNNSFLYFPRFISWFNLQTLKIVYLFVHFL